MCIESSASSVRIQVEYLVLDESDKLYELSLLEPVDAIVKACTNPSIIRSLFSATLPDTVEELAHTITHEAVRVIIVRKTGKAITTISFPEPWKAWKYEPFNKVPFTFPSLALSLLEQLLDLKCPLFFGSVSRNFDNLIEKREGRRAGEAAGEPARDN
nr:DEAD-box ATP-dependent RNA helicase 57 [Tanacetum cinerariifolium]